MPMLVLFAAAAFAAPAAPAPAPAAPATQAWSVVGVATPAAVTLRASPADAAAAVAELAPGTAGLVELEHHPDGWIKVRAGKAEGWVRDAVLAPTAPVDGLLPARLQCSGSEPGWSVALKDGKAQAASPDRPDAPWVDATVTHATQPGTWLVTPQGKGPGFRWLVVRAGRCAAGATGMTLPYGAEALTAEAGFVVGCCRLAE